MKKLTRRRFLTWLGIGTGAAGATAFMPRPPAPALPATVDGGSHGLPPHQEGPDFEEIDRLHEEGVNTFLGNIGQDPDFWGLPLEFEIDDDGAKVFRVTCQQVDWETEPGTSFPAFAYNGKVPGPEIRITEGDRVRIHVTNEMNESTTVHWHGVLVPSDMDGVGYISQPPIRPGDTFTYEFTARNPGTHMYHSHHNAAEQVVRGLMGAFIIEPQDTSREPVVDAEYIMVLNDSGLGFTINGKSFPYTQPIIANLGDKIRIRYMNEGLMIHPMHLHGIPQLVFAKDGFHLPAPYMCDTLNIAPGERYDVLVDCTEPGAWAFHCHILTHAESRSGMFGMVTALVVQA